MKYTTGLLFLTACLSLNVARAAEDDKPKGDRPERGERMKEMMEKRAEELKAADADKDGSITLDELKAQAATRSEEMFKKMDKDSDGKVTKEEAKAAREALGGAGGPGGRGPGGRGPGGPDAAPEGDMTLDAFKARAAERAEGAFKRMDKDNDGKVTEAEIKAMGEGRGERRGGRDGGDKPPGDKGPKPESGAGFGPQGAPPPAQ